MYTSYRLDCTCRACYQNLHICVVIPSQMDLDNHMYVRCHVWFLEGTKFCWHLLAIWLVAIQYSISLTCESNLERNTREHLDPLP